MSRRLLPVLMMVWALVDAQPAPAYESECRSPEDAAPLGGRFSSYDASICAHSNGTPVEECIPGPAFARGVQMGEHSWLARRAMMVAGLSDFTSDSGYLAYYTNGSTVTPTARDLDDPPGAPIPTFMPADIRRLTTRVQRDTTIHEFANLPDGSHSVTDYLMGNEHCIVSNLPSGDPAGLRACHTFRPHMGAINSSHFVPQSEGFYRRYHAIALAIAQRCAAMEEAFEAAPDSPVSGATAADAVELCEQEALVFQSMASHYLGDAWASGHMWERWGAPLVPDVQQEALKLGVVAPMAGLIHGWRSVIWALGVPDLLGIDHDRLSMPGFYDSDERREHPEIYTTAFLQGEGAHAVGGDLYLLPCNAVDRDTLFAVSTGPDQLFQFNRMMTCMALGFQEVYSAGPETHETLNPTYPETGALRPTSSLDSGCWDFRVNNRSFVEGMGLGVLGLSLAEPSFASRIAVGEIASAIRDDLAAIGIIQVDYDAIERQLDWELTRMATHASIRARTNPTDTDLAVLEHDAMDSLLGVPRNGAFVDANGDLAQPVHYLEAANPGVWNETGTLGCGSDGFCQTMAPGTYCDDTVSGELRCRPHEAAALRVFRQAEMPYWCSHVTEDDIDRVRQNCRDQGSSSDACRACVDVVLPHVRNDCDETVYEPDRDDVNRRSMCDILVEAGVTGAVENVPIYLPYDESDEDNAIAAVTEYCNATPVTSVGMFWRPLVDIDDVRLTAGTPSRIVTVTTQAPSPFDLEWEVTRDDLGSADISVDPTAFGTIGDNTSPEQEITFSASSFDNTQFADFAISNQCTPDSVRANVHVTLGDIIVINFDDAPAGGFTGTFYTESDGVTFSSSTGLFIITGDDSHSTPQALCGTTDGSNCNSDIAVAINPPVQAVSFYVGDVDLDNRGTVSITVNDDTGGLVDSVSTNLDRRFFSFEGDDIATIHFSPSSENELMDDLQLVP